MCRILIVDDHEFVRKGIRRLLSARTDVRVCGEAEDGIEAVERAKGLRPDVILMDLSMPRMDGTQATKIIRREVPEAQVILISQNDPSIVSVQAREAGAAASISKSDLAEQLIPTLDPTPRSALSPRVCCMKPQLPPRSIRVLRHAPDFAPRQHLPKSFPSQ